MFKPYAHSLFVLSFVCLSLCLIDCSGEKEKGPVIVRSFYHWKSDFSLTQNQNEVLEKLKIEEIYLHLFDVVWNGVEVEPTAVTKINADPNQALKPVIYLTTTVFTHLDSIQIADLAKKISVKVSHLMKNRDFTEIQFDCDWMPSIKDKYFYFLEEMKNHFSNKVISATIRLYQYKYPDLAGVPPVNKGLLMYYNMGELTNLKESNSILNNEKGFQYLGFNDYPLPIDIALPNFEWAVVFRGDQFVRITNDFNEEDYKKRSLFNKARSNFYMIEKDTVFNGNYYRYGDLIRPETCLKTNLIAAAEQLVDEINQDTTRIIFYDLKENTYKDYEKLDAVFTVFE